MAFKVLIDANIIMDVLAKREPFYHDALNVFHLCETSRVNGVIAAITIPNLVYILRKELPRDQVEELLGKLSQIFHIADLKADDLHNAATLPMPDYEDALQAVCAQRIRAQYIITRNPRDFAESPVRAILPKELVAEVIG